MLSDEELIEALPNAQEFLESEFGSAPNTVVILGSGLSPFAEQLSNTKSCSVTEVPGSAQSTVAGHAGKIVLGNLESRLIKNKSARVLVMAGRVHGYEGHSPTQVVHNLRALRLWGVKKFILTNAAGSTSLAYKPGSLVLLSDHINFTGKNPLTGTELFGGPRFPDMSEVYSNLWRKKALQVSKKIKLNLKQGVYIKVNGPNYESPSEIKMFAKWGAQLVGMSTVWEAIALKQMGAEVLGLSCVTNYGTGVTKKPLSHEEVIATTKKVQTTFNRFMTELMIES